MPTVVMIDDYADNTVTKIFSAISKKPTSDNYAITIKSGGTASDKVATIPDAVTGLTYNGKIQTGVPEGAGYVITDNTGKDAGDYAATAELIPGYVWDDGTNVDKTINWSIGKRPLLVTADDKLVTYPNPAPIFTVRYNSFYGGEDAAVLLGTLDFDCTYDGTVYQAIFSITPKGLTSDNYAISFISGTLTVERGIATLSEIANLTYNGQTQTGIHEGIGYMITGNKGIDASYYVATASLKAGYMWSGGSTEDKAIPWSINKRVLTVTADNKSTKFPNPAPEFTVTYDGFVNEETEIVLSGTLKFDCDYDCTFYQLLFDIIPEGLTSKNYDIMFVKGVLVLSEDIAKAPKAIPNLTYNGEIQIGVLEGTGYMILCNTGKDAVDYNAILILEPGYTWSDGTTDDKIIPWTISKKILTVTADNKSTKFPNPAPEFTAKYDGFVNGETETVLSGNLKFDCDYDGTTYRQTFDIIPKGPVDNYEIFPVSGILTVDLGTAYVPGATTGLIYNGQILTGVSDGAGYQLSGNTAISAGDYIATANLIYGYRWGDGSDTEKTIMWTIAKRNLIITADNKIVTFPENAPEFTVTCNGFIAGECIDNLSGTISFSCAYDGIIHQEYFLITPGGLTSKNYNILFVPGTLAVYKKTITVPTAVSLIYNGQTQTGIPFGEGYTLSGNTGKDVKEYVATASLEAGYTWSDGATDKMIVWAIGKKDLTIKAENQSVTFPETVPKFIATCIGLADGETETVLGGTLAFACDYDGSTYAATFPITPSGYASGNYAITYVPGTLTVSKGTATFPSAAPDLVYDGTVQTGVSGGTGYTITGNTGKDATNYTAQVAISDGYVWNDSGADVRNIPWSVAKRTLTVATSTESKVYDGTELKGTGTMSGLVSPETATLVLTGSQINVGSSDNTYTIDYGTAKASNYTVSATLGTLEVTKKALTVTADNKSVTFPASASGFTVTYDGFENGETEAVLGGTLAFACDYNGSSYAATFPITPSGYTSSNYNITYFPGTLTVSKGTATFPSANSPTYNGQNQTGVPAGTGYDLTGDHEAVNAGGYTATATLKKGYEWSDDNMSESRNVTWAMAKKTITVKANNTSVTYPALPSFSVTYGKFAPGDDYGDLGGGLAYECNYNGTSYAASFIIIPKGLNPANYVPDYQTGTLTVEKASVTVPGAFTDLTYNGKTQIGVSEGIGYTLEGNTGKDAKDYTATASLRAGYEWSDGTVTHRAINWSISKKGLTVTADGKSIEFSDPIPGFTVTYDGFVNGETSTVLGGSLGFVCDYDRTVYAPTFAITPKGLTSDNYGIVFAEGILTVHKAAITAPDAVGKLVYNGKTQIGVLEGTGYTLEGNTGKGAGDYVAYAKLVAGYKWSDDSVADIAVGWSISKKELTVTADDKSQVYLESVPEFTVTYGEFAETEDRSVLGGVPRFSCAYDGTAYRPMFTISPSGHTSDNYEIIFVDGTLTVDKISVSVPGAVTDLIYNGKTQTGVFERTGYTLEGNTGTNAGSYSATAFPEAGYEWSDGTAADKTIGWKISKKNLTVTADDKSMTFLESVPEFTVTYDGFVNGESEAVLERFPGCDCAYDGKIYRETFVITPKGCLSDNYEMDFVNGILTVGKACATRPQAITGLIYNGTVQTGIPKGIGYRSVSNASAVNAGDYVATVSPEAGYLWSDETDSDIKIGWTIGRKDVTVTTSSASKTYDGEALVAGGSVEGLVEGDGVMFTVTGIQKNAGTSFNTYSLTPGGSAGTDNYNVTENLGTLTVNRARLEKPTAGKTFILYDGTEKTYCPSGFDGSTMEIEGNKGTRMGLYKDVIVFIKDMINYEWTDGKQLHIPFEFHIVLRTLPNAEAVTGVVYNGESQAPTLTIRDDNAILTEGKDYKVVWNDTEFVNAGTYTADVTGIGKYSNFYTVKYVISKIRLDVPTADPNSFIYDGEEKIYNPVGFDGKTMDILGNRRANEGTQTVTVSIKDTVNYEWADGTQNDAEFTFTVGYKILPEPEVAFDVTYNGKPQMPAPMVADGFTVLNMGIDYVVVWNDAEFVNAGVYMAKITGIGEYSGTRTISYVIAKVKLDKPTEDTTVFVCDGTEKTYRPVGFDETIMGVEGNVRTDAGSQTVTVSILDEMNYEWADGTQENLTFRFVVGAPSNPPAAKESNGIYTAVAAAAAVMILIFCVRYFYGRP